MRKSKTMLVCQLAFALLILGTAGKMLWQFKQYTVVMMVGGPEKFNRLQADANRHAQQFIIEHGGSALLEWNGLGNNEPTVYVLLHLHEGYTVHPDGRVEKNGEEKP